ncbi:MAG TPA: hypothetical protein VHB51_00855 [Candidatus Saccharimonadales bacterium]|nr:hypothetical protein [Candidatus Saccharimonadales bacterium]
MAVYDPEPEDSNKPGFYNPHDGSIQNGLGSNGSYREKYLSRVRDQEDNPDDSSQGDDSSTSDESDRVNQISGDSSGHANRGRKSTSDDRNSNNDDGGSFKRGGKAGAGKTGTDGVKGADGGGAAGTAGLFRAADPMGGLGKAVQFLGKNKGKAGAAGGGLTALILLLVMGFGAVASFELETIAKDISKDVSKIEQAAERNSSKRLIKKIKKRLEKKATANEAEKAAMAAEDSAGRLASEMDKFNFTDSEVKARLAARGIHVKTNAAGEFTGFEDAAGNDITKQIGEDNAFTDAFNEALPEADVMQLKPFQAIETEHAGSTFDGIPEDTPPEETQKTIEDKIMNGASESDIISAEAGDESDDGQVDENNPDEAKQASDFDEIKKQGGELGDALEATQESLAKGESGASALSKGVKSFKLGNPILASQLATMACGFKKDVDEVSKARIPLIMHLLTRHFTLVMSLAGQLVTGHLKGATVAKVMSVWNGDQSVKPTKDDPNPEAAMPFSKSAAWQRITGGTIDDNPKSPGFTPDIAKSALPSKNTGTKIVEEIDKVFSKIKGANLSCKVLTSKFGFIVQTVVGIGQLFADLGSLGASQVAITAGIVATQQLIEHVVLPDIIKYFTPVGIYGGEDSVQQLNNTHAGGVIAESDFARSNGGEPLTTSKANEITRSQNAHLAMVESRKPWTERTFSLDDPGSLVSRMALYLPVNTHQMVGDVASFFATLPQTLGHVFSNLITPHIGALTDNDQSAGAAYDITEYGFTEADANKYDVLENEKYLNTTVTYNGNSATRLEMAGDPNNFLDGVIDSSDTDLLHCYLQSYTQEDSNGQMLVNDDGSDKICGSLGNYDLGRHAPQPMTDTNVAISYCEYLEGSSSPSGDCLDAVIPQLHDDIGHFRQYILDSHVMHAYTLLVGS